jgi:hypothetical protein
MQMDMYDCDFFEVEHSQLESRIRMSDFDKPGAQEQVLEGNGFREWQFRKNDGASSSP